MTIAAKDVEHQMIKNRVSRIATALLIGSGSLSLALSAAAGIGVDPTSVVGQAIIDAPENSWVLLNVNRFVDVWTPVEHRPAGGARSPDGVVEAWSSMAWDSRRGHLIFWGGGHANYPGNEVYRWMSASGEWTRASLPSEIMTTPWANGNIPMPDQPVDGYMNAPIAAHAFEGQEYLPVVDRFITFGGAAWNTGGAFTYPDADNNARQTGPYLWDPNKADPNKVSGTTGSHANPDLFPDVIGGEMWQNRDTITIIRPQVTKSDGTIWQNTWVGGSVSAYSDEDPSVDTLYFSAKSTLYRYVIRDVNDPSTDTFETLGVSSNSQPTAGWGAGGLDPVRNLFVRTSAFSNGDWFFYWNLDPAVAGSRNQYTVFTPSDPSGLFRFTRLEEYGLDYSAGCGCFVLWDGTEVVWYLHPPAILGAAGWTLERIVPGGVIRPSSSDPNFIPGGSYNGIIGKWKYVREYDGFFGVQDSVDGNIWFYKPAGWAPVFEGGGRPPEVTIDSPADGSVFLVGSTISFGGSATDAEDGSLSGTIAWSSDLDGDLGSGASVSVGGLRLGIHQITARVTDSDGLSDSASILIEMSDGNIPPSVVIGTPSDGSSFVEGSLVAFSAAASDPEDGILDAQIQWASDVDGALGAGSSISTGALSRGSHVVTASVTDSGGRSASASVSVSITGVPGVVNFIDTPPQPYAGQDTSAGSATVSDGGTTLDMVGNTWKMVPFAYTVVPNTVLEFEFRSSQIGEVHAIGFENQPLLTRAQLFTLAGSQGFGPRDFVYTGGGEWVRFRIPVGQYYTGSFSNLAFINDDDANAGADGHFRNVTVYDDDGSTRTAPTVSIASPADGSVFPVGVTIDFSGVGDDVEDGDLSAAIAWNSDRDGPLGTGNTLSTGALSVGIHQITARVTDSHAMSATAVISIEVSDGNTPPVVTIGSPAGGSSFDEGALVSFSATASDSEDGNLDAFIDWRSDLDGALGSGPSIVSNALRRGTHQITASVSDSNGRVSETSISIAITGLPGVVNFIDSPPQPYAGQDTNAGSVSVTDAGATLNMVGNTWKMVPFAYVVSPNTVLEFEFRSSLIGEVHAIGFENAPQLTRAQLFTLAGSQAFGPADFTYAGNGDWVRFRIPVGQYYTGSFSNLAFINDDDANTGADGHFRNVTVYEDDGTPRTPPTVSIGSPADGSVFLPGETVTLTGTGDDAEDGSLTASIAWTSDRDGFLGSGGSLAVSSLSLGIHRITASVTDSDGISSAVAIDIEVTDGNLPPLIAISEPVDGSTFEEGSPVLFTASASDAEDGDLDAAIVWTSDRDGALGSGAGIATSLLSRGSHLITASVTDSGGRTVATTVTISITGLPGVVNFIDSPPQPYGGQDPKNSNVTVTDAGATLVMDGNAWKMVPYAYTVTPNTVLEFEFRSDLIGEIHGIGFENAPLITRAQLFTLAGSQNLGPRDFTYDGSGEWVLFQIPVGQYYTGSFANLVFINDDDANAGAHGEFRNVTLRD